MGQRIDVTTWARLSGRSESTLRKWLAEEPPPLEVIEGPPLGQKRKGGERGRRRWVDVDEARALHEARGGTAWREDWLPATTAEALRAELDALTRRVAALEASRTRRRETIETIAPIERTPTETFPSFPSASFGTTETFPEAALSSPRQTTRTTETFPSLAELALLPSELVSAASYARKHGMKQDTQWKEQAKNKTPERKLHLTEGRWTNGRNAIFHALDAAGRREFGGFFGHLPWWQMCEEEGCEACEEARRVQERRLAAVGLRN